MMKYQRVKGMSDITWPEVQGWQFVEEQAHIFFGARLYMEIRTPVLEYTELFRRSIGEASDIVNKQMYSFVDRGERSLTLRPEMTASVIRAVIENNLLHEREPLKLFYSGPMFRAERPQAGRRRQFYQIGVEIIGNDDPFCDAEVIKDLACYLQAVGLRAGEYTIALNNIGCEACRPAYLKKLREYFTAQKRKLCKDCSFKFEKNILRIFDCKNAACITLVQAAPKITDAVCRSCSEHFKTVVNDLKRFNVAYTIDKNIVRGLDYYTSTVFEVTSPQLGAKDAIAAGGRYNTLMQDLGGDSKSAIGFAIGVERLLTCLGDRVKDGSTALLNKTVYVAYGDQKYREECKKIGVRLEKCGYPTYMDLDQRSLKSQMKRANKFGLRWVLILNKDEVTKGKCSLKDLRGSEKEQKIITIDAIEKEIRNVIGK